MRIATSFSRRLLLHRPASTIASSASASSSRPALISSQYTCIYRHRVHRSHMPRVLSPTFVAASAYPHHRSFSLPFSTSSNNNILQRQRRDNNNNNGVGVTQHIGMLNRSSKVVSSHRIRPMSWLAAAKTITVGAVTGVASLAVGTVLFVFKSFVIVVGGAALALFITRRMLLRRLNPAMFSNSEWFNSGASSARPTQSTFETVQDRLQRSSVVYEHIGGIVLMQSRGVQMSKSGSGTILMVNVRGTRAEATARAYVSSTGSLDKIELELPETGHRFNIDTDESDVDDAEYIDVDAEVHSEGDSRRR